MKIANYSPEKKRLKQHQFPCEQCGAELTFSPGTHHQECRYCGHTNPIRVSHEPIREYDFREALQELERLKKEPNEIVQVLSCSSCGAEFSLQPNEHAGDCPFCSAPAVVTTDNARYIHPESLLPFIIKEKQAQQIFDEWIGSRWFAPSALKNKSRRDEKLTGIYLPYWTYDSDTETRYRGMRGNVYYVRQYVTVVVNGRPVRQVQNVPKIRWTPVSGQVDLHFDDVLVGATKTLPRTIIDNLQPWDLDALVPYSAEYLSGFRSEIYQVTLDQGFQTARNRMEKVITHNIYRDIGGDQQRISGKNTRHYDTTFKHILLPVWSAAFRYNRKTYRFVINARTGQIQGERPFSAIKIALSAIVVIAVISGMIYLSNKSGLFVPGTDKHYYSLPEYHYGF